MAERGGGFCEAEDTLYKLELEETHLAWVAHGEEEVLSLGQGMGELNLGNAEEVTLVL